MLDTVRSLQFAATLALFAVVLIAAAPARAQGMKGDAEAGHEYAATWCSHCHAVDRSASSGGTTGPSFLSIAKRRSTTTRKLIRFFYSKHNNMPDFEIELDDASNVAAHILSLRRK